MKIKPKTMPQIFYVNYIRKDPIEIRLKQKDTGKGYHVNRQHLSSTISTLASSAQKIKLKLKASLPKYNKDESNPSSSINPKEILQEFTASLEQNPNANSNQLAKLLGNLSSMPFQDILNNNLKSDYTKSILKKRRNEQNFEERINALYDKMTIQPMVKHWDFFPKDKGGVCNSNSKSTRSNTQRPKSCIPLPIEIKDKIIRNYNKIPYIFRGSQYNFNFIKGRQRSYDAKEVYDTRYDKKKINIEDVVLNYHANAQKNFSSRKIEQYHSKKSPFVVVNKEGRERFSEKDLKSGLFIGRCGI